jgi:hypothetical protein
LKEQLAELKMTIQEQQQQNQQPSAPPALNPHSMSPSDPGMLALREQVAELKTIIQAQQQQLQQMSTVQSLNPPSLTLPPELAATIQDIVMASLSNFRAEFQNLHQTTSAPSPARKKVCPNAQTSESHLSEASLAAREDDNAAMDLGFMVRLWGIHCHLLRPQVFQWMSGWEMNFPLSEPLVPPEFILLMRMEFGMEPGVER